MSEQNKPRFEGIPTSFAESVQRARAGEFREYWLQLYFLENYRKLGFSEIEGPFDVGPDFKGVYGGKRVEIEVETRTENFIYHRHDPKQVDVLIVLTDDCNKDVLGMSPNQWRARLPKRILKVDAEDFVTATHEMRKAYALIKKEQMKSLPMRLRIAAISGAFEILWWTTTGEDIPEEDTPDRHAFKEATTQAAMEYINFYRVEISEEFSATPEFTRIEVLANDLVKSHRQLDSLNAEETEFVENWVAILREKLSSVF